MQLTCAHCHTTYRVNAHLIGETGRKVRCTTCGEVWMSPPASAEALAKDQKIPQHDLPPLPKLEVPQEPAPEDLMFIVEEKQPEEQPARPEWDREEESTGEEDDEVLGFRNALQRPLRENVQAPPVDDFPQSLRPLVASTATLNAGGKKFDAPVMDHKPFNLGAAPFGAAVFLLLAFSSLLVLFAGKGPLVRAAPSMASFYRALGFTLNVPGDGFSLSAMTADSHVDGVLRTVTVSARLANISAVKMDTPAMQVTVRDKMEKVLKSWSFDPEEQKELASGDGVPVSFTLKDAPLEAKTADIKVIGR